VRFEDDFCFQLDVSHFDSVLFLVLYNIHRKLDYIYMGTNIFVCNIQSLMDYVALCQ
jgi:hypothetical protein